MIELLREENKTLLEELKKDRSSFRNGGIDVKQAHKLIGFANASCRSIKTGLDIEKFSFVLSQEKNKPQATEV